MNEKSLKFAPNVIYGNSFSRNLQRDPASSDSHKERSRRIPRQSSKIPVPKSICNYIRQLLRLSFPYYQIVDISRKELRPYRSAIGTSLSSGILIPEYPGAISMARPKCRVNTRSFRGGSVTRSPFPAPFAAFPRES